MFDVLRKSGWALCELSDWGDPGKRAMRGGFENNFPTRCDSEKGGQHPPNCVLWSYFLWVRERKPLQHSIVKMVTSPETGESSLKTLFGYWG